VGAPHPAPHGDARGVPTVLLADGKLQPRALRLGTEVAHEPQVPADLVLVLRIGDPGGRIEQAHAGRREAADSPSAERTGDLQRRSARAIHLQRHVEPRRPRPCQERRDIRVPWWPLGDAPVPRERQQLVDPRPHALDDRRHLGERDECHASARQPPPQRAQRRHRAQKVAQAGPQPNDRHRPRLVIEGGAHADCLTPAMPRSSGPERVRARAVPASMPDDGPPLTVLRICSVFEPPDAALTGRGTRFDPVGGMQNHTGQLTRALDRRCIRHIVVTHRPPGAPRHHGMADHAEVHRFGLPIARPRQLYWLGAGPAAVRLARHAELVHAHLGEDLAVLPIALAAARAARLPLVVTIHCSLRHTLRSPGARAAVLRHVGGTIETSIARRADAVIALTRRRADELAADGVPAERIRVIPSGVDPALFGRDVPDPFPTLGRPRVVYVGRLARSKGVPALVQAAALLRTPDARVLLVGDGPARATIERMIHRHGLADRVRITGFMAHREIPAVLRHADVFCLPSHYEELGTAVLEAMQAGLPIVASDTGGIPAAVGPAARLVPPGDAGALAAALDALLADPAQAMQLARLGRERPQSMGWERLAPRVLDVYRTVLARPHEHASDRPSHEASAAAVTAR
jgi:glycogen synthase